MKKIKLWKRANPIDGRLLLSICGLFAGILLSSQAMAYDNYNGCNDCHAGFRNDPYVSLVDGTNWATDLMAGHINFINSCDVCHSGSGFKQVITSFSGNADKPQGCVGCHGRVGDESNVCTFGAADVDGELCGSGAGLRKLHEASPKVPANTCYQCHTSETGVIPVGEDELPFNHGRAGIGLSSPCLAENIFGPTGLDNDGDGAVDGADTDCSPPVSAPYDFNNDGKSDILLRNVQTGANQLYVMNGAVISQNVPVNSVPADWNLIGRGDYNDDGYADILWRHVPTGAIWIYLMNGSTVSSSLFVGTISDSNWKVVGNGDYNGDGKSDILWHHAVNGTVWLYEMNSNIVTVSTGIGVVPNTDWQIVGSGDYNGDGRSDVLWRNVVSGANWMYLMNGSTITTSVGISVTPDQNWKIVGTGDYNGDRKSDILWRHGISGTNWLYLMNGTSIATSGSISVLPDANWTIVGDGDYNGDGKADVLWRNLATGSNWMYLMDGLTISGSASVSTIVDQNWKIVNTK